MEEDPISLIDYLQRGLPSLPLNIPASSSQSTTDSAYDANDIPTIGVWKQFTLSSILRHYQGLLTTTTLLPNPFADSPPLPVHCKDVLYGRINEMAKPRIRRSLRAGFNQLRAIYQLSGITPLSIDHGDAALTPGGFVPDLSYWVIGQDMSTGPNRAPGKVEVSWKWNTAQSTGSATDKQQFKQALSQVNWYMKQHKTRYGFIITDLEMVAIRRLDNDGDLELSRSIPWETQGGPQPRLTVLLAMWYLGMLAAQDRGPEQWDIL